MFVSSSSETTRLVSCSMLCPSRVDSHPCSLSHTRRDQRSARTPSSAWGWPLGVYRGHYTAWRDLPPDTWAVSRVVRELRMRTSATKRRYGIAGRR